MQVSLMPLILATCKVQRLTITIKLLLQQQQRVRIGCTTCFNGRPC